MNILLKSSVKEHRDIARLFGVLVCSETKSFIESYVLQGEYNLMNKGEIIVSLDAPMDLRMAVNTDIQFYDNQSLSNWIVTGINFENGQVSRVYVETPKFDEVRYDGLSLHDDLELSTKYLISIGVEVEE